MRFADLHVDTLNRARERKWDLLRGAPDAHVDLPRLRSSGVGCLGLSLWADPERDAVAWTEDLLEDAHGLMASAPDDFALLLDRASLREVDGGRVGLLITVEGAHGIGDSLERMERLVARGVRSLTLTWNNSNGLADSSREERDPSGLTPLGHEFVAALRRWGCVVDLSHVSKATFWDAMEVASDGSWVSHSACETLARHPRNLDDEQIRALSRADSVIGVVVYPEFLGPDDPESVTLETVADHIEHAVSVGGIRCVALGSDFDGISLLPRGMKGVEDFPKLFEVLMLRGWTEDMLEALCWRNAMRVLERSLPAAQ
jgi:membrane dipeptidase